MMRTLMAAAGFGLIGMGLAIAGVGLLPTIIICAGLVLALSAWSL